MGCGSGGKTIARVDISASRDRLPLRSDGKTRICRPVELGALASSVTTPGRGSAVRS
jgi:hypothetical protein